MTSAERQLAGRERSPWRLALWFALLAAGAAAWSVAWGDVPPRRAWLAMLIAFVYVTPLAAGLVVWSAVALLARGKWAGNLERIALSGLGFAVPSLAVLAALLWASPDWAPWMSQPVSQGAWYDKTIVMVRDVGALGLFWILAAGYVWRRRAGRGKVVGGWLIVTYCFVFTLLGFDLVMGLDPQWRSMVFGAYIFISGMYLAAAGWTLASMFSRFATPQRVHDLAKLTVAFSILTGYLGYAGLLPTWYENMPAETRFFIPRINYEPWRWVSVAIVGIMYLGPLVLLLTIKAKRTWWFLGAVLAGVMAVAWIERAWLVLPTFAPREIPVGLPEAGAAAALLGALGLGAELFLRSDRTNFEIEVRP